MTLPSSELSLYLNKSNPALPCDDRSETISHWIWMLHDLTLSDGDFVLSVIKVLEKIVAEDDWLADRLREADHYVREEIYFDLLRSVAERGEFGWWTRIWNRRLIKLATDSLLRIYYTDRHFLEAAIRRGKSQTAS